MATVAEVRAERRSGLIVAIAIIMGLIGLVAANFTFNDRGQWANPEVSFPAPAPASGPAQ